MTTKRTVLLQVLTFCLAVSISAAFADEPVCKKKLIELGWDIPTTEYIAKHWREMEANAPFSGVMYDLVATSPDGRRCASQTLFTRDAWEREWFESCVRDLDSCEFQRYRDNFIRVNFSPADFAWDDEEAWKNVCDKSAICAWAARETNGSLCFDFESYGSALFRYDSRSGMTFQDAKALARRRGAEMCSAIVGEFPQVKILCLWMNSINVAAGKMEDPDRALRGSGYGLLPAFIDGLLDALTPEALLIDGCETGYYMNGSSQYDRAACDMLLATGPCVALVSPENRKKYRAQVQAGFGFYLDMYSNPEGSTYYRGPEEGETRFDRLAANLRAAVNASDQYVWVYGEQKRWWKPENAKSDDDWVSWEEALPGVADLVDELDDPKAAIQRLKRRVFELKDAKDLIVNGDFSDVADGRPTSWNTWQIETEPVGKFVAEDGRAVLKGMANGCYIQTISVKPGERYLVVAKAKRQACAATIRIRWQDRNSKWVNEGLDVFIESDDASETDENGMRELVGAVVVPQDTYKLVVLLSASGSESEGVAAFDDVRVYGTNL